MLHLKNNKFRKSKPHIVPTVLVEALKEKEIKKRVTKSEINKITVKLFKQKN